MIYHHLWLAILGAPYDQLGRWFIRGWRSIRISIFHYCNVDPIFSSFISTHSDIPIMLVCIPMQYTFDYIPMQTTTTTTTTTTNVMSIDFIPSCLINHPICSCRHLLRWFDLVLQHLHSAGPNAGPKPQAKYRVRHLNHSFKPWIISNLDSQSYCTNIHHIYWNMMKHVFVQD